MSQIFMDAKFQPMRLLDLRIRDHVTISAGTLGFSTESEHWGKDNKDNVSLETDYQNLQLAWILFKPIKMQTL